MSKRELIEAYIRGDLDRRQFVSRLTMLGVSGGAAVAYASSLGRSAAAAPTTPASGYVMRAQAADDGEYGTALAMSVIEGLTRMRDDVQAFVLSVLAGLDQFSEGDFPPGRFQTLGTIRSQQEEHLDAINSQIEANEGAATNQVTRFGFQTQQFESPEAFLMALSDGFEKLTASYAGVVPAVDSGEVRQALMSTASVANRHASVVNNFAGVPEFPSTFQPAELPEI